jgi:hypothetical protein
MDVSLGTREMNRKHASSRQGSSPVCRPAAESAMVVKQKQVVLTKMFFGTVGKSLFKVVVAEIFQNHDVFIILMYVKCVW